MSETATSPGIPIETIAVRPIDLERLAITGEDMLVWIIGRSHNCRIVKKVDKYHLYWAYSENHATVQLEPGMLRRKQKEYSLTGRYTIHVSDKMPIATSPTTA